MAFQIYKEYDEEGHVGDRATIVVIKVEQKVREINYGLSMLKLLACFMVVGIHEGLGVRGNTYAVPVFMVAAFFLSGKLMFAGLKGYSRRLLKILYPLWFWSVIGLIVMALQDGKIPSISKIFLQMTLGHSFIRSLWFLPCLALLTSMYWALSGLSKKIHTLVLFLLFSGAILLQYSALPTMLKNYVPSELSYPIGRFVEMIPCSILGVVMAKHVPLFPAIDRKMVGAIVFLIVLSIIGVLMPCSDGFTYQGLQHPSVAAMAVYFALLAGSTLRFLKIRFNYKLTPGIYYSHTIVGSLLPIACGAEKTVVVFVVCAIIVFIINLSKYTRPIVT